MSTSDETSDLPFRTLRHYQIRGRIGRSRQGDLYRAFEPELDRLVEIETLDQSLSVDESVVWRFYLQASAAAKLSHPNVLQVYFVGTDRGRYFQARECVEGETLAQRLSRMPRLSLDDALRIARQILSGLAAIERHGRVAADLDAANILLDGQNGRVVLTRLEAIDSPADTLPAAASLSASAPAGEEPPPRTTEVQRQRDLHAVGILMYRMLADPADQQPADALLTTHSQIEQRAIVLGTLSVPLTEILSRLLGLSPESDPYSSVQSVLDDLQPLFRDRISAESLATVPQEQFRTASAAAAPGRGHAASMIVEMPPLDVLPELPPALRMRPKAQKRGVLSRLGGWIVRHRPEPIDRMLGTQFACHAALAECQRRHDVLSEMEREAEAMLRELQQQVAAAPAGQAGSALLSAVSEQQKQLSAIRAKLATLSATLQRLQFEGDALQARLSMADARSRPAGRKRQPASRIVTQIVMVTGLLILAGYLVWDNYSLELKRQFGALKLRRPSPPAVPDRKLIADLRWIPESSLAIPFRRLRGHLEGITGLAFLPGRRLLVSSSHDGTLRFWIPESGEEMRYFAPTGGQDRGLIDDMALSPDGRTIAAISHMFKNQMMLIDAATGDPIRAVQGRIFGIQSVAFSPDGTKLALLHNDSTTDVFGMAIHLFDVATGFPSLKIDTGKDVRKIAFSPSKPWLAFWGSKTPLTLWNTQTDRLLRQIDAGAGVGCAAFDAGGGRLAIGHVDGSISIHDLESGELLARLRDERGPPEPIKALAFSPDGRRLAVAHQNLARIWNLSGPVVDVYGIGTFEFLAFSSDSRFLAAGGHEIGDAADRNLLLWRMQVSQEPGLEGRERQSSQSNPDVRRDVTLPLPKTEPLAGYLKAACYLNVMHQPYRPEFIQNIQSAARLLPPAEVAVGTASARWSEVRMNEHGCGIDCIRFVSPLSEAADLHLAFAGNVKTSGTVPMRGEKVESGPAVALYNVDLPPLHLSPGVPVTFRVERGTIAPHGEYVLWFYWETTEPVQFQFALHLRKAQPEKPRLPLKADDVASAMGWPVPIPQVGVYGSPSDPLRPIQVNAAQWGAKPPFLEDRSSGNRILNSGLRKSAR